MVASRSGLDHPGLPLGEQAGDQHARLDLGAGHRKLVGDAVERRTVDAKRRQATVAALHRGPHHPQRLGNPVDGTAPDRLVSIQDPSTGALARQPARQDAKQGAGVLHPDRDRPGAGGEALPRAAQPDPAHPQVAAAARVGRTDLFDLRAQRLNRVQGGSRVRRVEIALDRRRPLPHRPDQRRAMADRLVRRGPQGAAQRPGRGESRHRVTASRMRCGPVPARSRPRARPRPARRPRARPRPCACPAPGPGPCPRC